ncbi:MAG: phosphate ABC transporter permease subunit PstC [Acidimicrobiia bacterium]|nr:phosphate ABC transporter permease subunit PstC [Acidimicrobiia bacterium]
MTTSTSTIQQIDLSGDRRRQRRESRIRAVFFAAAALSMLISMAIVVSLAGEAWSFVSAVDMSAFFDSGWLPRRGRYSILTIFWHTLMVSAIAMVVATPLGLGAAVYLSEYARRNVRRFLKPTLEILAGIPSVVLGFFALNFLTPSLIQPIIDVDRSNLLAAGIGVGILIVPLVASVSEDAMRAVPKALREASYGLGAKKWHTSLRVVVPAALSGIVAALILALSRAVGETMVVALAAGTSGILTWLPDTSGLTMTGAMANLAIGSDQVTSASSVELNPFQSLFFIGLMLFVITLLLNLLSERVVRRFRQKY